VLFADPAAAEKKLAATYDGLIDARANGLIAEVKATYTLAAATWKVPASEPVQSELERQASRAVVERVPVAAGARPAGGGGGRGGPQSAIPGHMTGEINALLGRGLTVLEIRDFISGEFEPVPLQDVWDYVKALETAGTVKLSMRR
jgi:hypothetical protein